MKQSFTRRAPISSIFSPIFTRSNNFIRPVSASSISYPPITVKPQTPLFLKPPIFSATVSDLKEWQNWAKTLNSSIGSSFLDSDNGPGFEILGRELNWLLEDALENPKLNPLKDSENGELSVKLRAKLEDLYVMWKQRIEERKPFQYIVGCEHWRDLVLSVENGVLIPRPETEMIVDLVSDVVERNEKLKEGLWADLGTGSGAIAIGIGRVLGDCGKVIGTDLSPIAVQVASYNVQRYNLQDRVVIKQGSWFEPLKEAEGELAGIVSNPPYIPSQHISGLQAEVAKHEPRLALDGGEDGMSDLLHLCAGAVSMLKPGGYFTFETNGEQQSKFLVNYMETETKGVFTDLKVVFDFAGVQRFVTGFKAS